MGGLFDPSRLSGKIVMCLAQHNRFTVPLSVCGQPSNWICRCAVNHEIQGICYFLLSARCEMCRLALMQLRSTWHLKEPMAVLPSIYRVKYYYSYIIYPSPLLTYVSKMGVAYFSHLLFSNSENLRKVVIFLGTDQNLFIFLFIHTTFLSVVVYPLP